MAKNLRQAGAMFYAPAPTGGVKSGDIAVVGTAFGVAGFDAAAGVAVALHNDGQIYSLTKNTPEAWTVGVAIYWDPIAKKATTVTTSNVKIGVAMAIAPAYTAAAASADTVGDVKLNEAF